MDMRPVLKSKITAPHLSESVLVTARIKELGIERHRIVSIVAPAGYGKTTAVIASIGRCANLHWYRLEKEDTRLPIFYAHLLETIFGRVKKREPECVQYFRSISNIAQGFELLNAAICQDAGIFYGGRAQKRHYIVFDDVHHIMESDPIIQTMRYFLTNMPENFHIVLVSRKDTGILSGVQGLSDDIRCLSEKDLSFGEEEIDLYMKQRGFIFPPGGAKQVRSQTEGWISGIVLIGNLVSRLGAHDIEALFRASDKKKEVFRFFLTEVMHGLAEDNIRAIALMATPEEFSVDIAESVFDIRNAQAILEYCEKMNLFLQKTVSDDTTYRFHSMFRHFLLDLRDDLFSREDIEAFNMKASGYYLLRQDYVGAVRHMLLARRMEDAIRLLCMNGKKMLDAGFGEHLRMFIEELPAPVMDGNPYLSFYYGFLLVSSEFDHSCAYLQRAAHLFELSGNTDMQVQALGVLFTAFAQRNDVAMIRKLVTELKGLAGKISSDDVRGTLLACSLGRAAFDEDFEEGLSLGEEIRQYKLNDIWRYGANNFLCMIHYRLGDLEKGKKFIEENLKMPIVRTNDQWKMLTMVFCHVVACYMDDTEWSAWIRSELLSLGEKYRSGYALGFGKRDAALARYRAHDIDHAVEYINASARHFRDYSNDAHVRRSAMYKNLWYLEKYPDRVNLGEVAEACAYLAEAPVGQGFAETAQSIAGIIYRETGQYDRAEALLFESFKASSAKKALQSMAGTAMHLAKLYFDLKDTGRGNLYLQTFITLSVENHFVSYYDLFFPTLVEMAARCVVQNIHPDYARMLVERYYGEKAAVWLIKNAIRLCSPKEARLFTERSVEAESGKRTIRITMLGGFKVAIGDDTIQESEWKTRKIQGILKYLLLRQGQFVSREVLADVFWPDTSGKAAMASLNVALYELRRVLSTHGIAFEDESPLIHDRGNGFEIVTSERLEVDIDRFVRLYDTYKLYEADGGEIRLVLTEMVEMYATGLLPQDGYEDWTMLERERLKSMFLKAVYRLFEIYIDEGALSEAETLLIKSLVVDPYDEIACGMLIDLYKQTGRKSAAQKISRSFEKRIAE